MKNHPAPMPPLKIKYEPSESTGVYPAGAGGFQHHLPSSCRRTKPPPTTIDPVLSPRGRGPTAGPVAEPTRLKFQELSPALAPPGNCLPPTAPTPPPQPVQSRGVREPACPTSVAHCAFCDPPAHALGHQHAACKSGGCDRTRFAKTRLHRQPSVARPEDKVTLSHDWHPRNDPSRGGGPSLCQGPWGMHSITHRTYMMTSLKARCSVRSHISLTHPSAPAGPEPVTSWALCSPQAARPHPCSTASVSTRLPWAQPRRGWFTHHRAGGFARRDTASGRKKVFGVAQASGPGAVWPPEVARPLWAQVSGL